MTSASTFAWILLATGCAAAAPPAPRAEPDRAPTGAVHDVSAPPSANDGAGASTTASAEPEATATTPSSSLDATPREPPTPPAGVPGALYAELFHAGKTWRFRKSLRLQSWDEAKQRADVSRGSSKVTCSVTRVVPHAWGIHSEIECEGHDDPFLGLPIAGFWAATPAGLHALDSEPTEAPPPASALIEPSPKRRDVKTATDPDLGWWSRERVTRSGSGWCIEFSYVEGDGGLSRRCFDPQVGFRSGASSFEGGHSRRYELELLGTSVR